MDEYNKTEIIRQSIKEVKARAEEDKKRRESPKKNAKGKISQNMKSRVKGKMIQQKEEKIPQW